MFTIGQNIWLTIYASVNYKSRARAVWLLLLPAGADSHPKLDQIPILGSLYWVTRVFARVQKELFDHGQVISIKSVCLSEVVHQTGARVRQFPAPETSWRRIGPPEIGRLMAGPDRQRRREDGTTTAQAWICLCFCRSHFSLYVCPVLFGSLDCLYIRLLSSSHNFVPCLLFHPHDSVWVFPRTG
ncbi:unnamed protein product [Protopolystoma xenopodis]|uniref:Uncharacterized protein n=1 Tax=Protopolystoma xenopodis TaxID=117903 RepID=A0A3S5C662_9PLAT|nr:unnamed protein product [Protopolystoma xenopodis]